VRLLLDENLSIHLVRQLGDVFPGIAHVHSVGLSGATDDELWHYAKTNSCAIVSKDSDFFERSVLDQHSAKVIWIRIGNCSTAELYQVLTDQQEVIRTFLADTTESCLLLSRNREK
jgi:predicted nuclease of predicted toxin-antitoxin system